MTSSRATTRRAFTLIELIAVMVVVAAIGVIGAMTMQRAAAANSQVATRGGLYTEASSAMDRIVRKLQSTPIRPSTDPAQPSIASFTDTTITFDDQSTITYDAAAQTITLRDTVAGDTATDTPVLIGYISSFAAAPYDESNNNLFTTLGVTTLDSTQSGSIRRVSIQFTITREGQSVTLRTRAFPRCCMAKTG
jgi:prepilin-type N-terminal cleavage/methylation domain-containing protein